MTGERSELAKGVISAILDTLSNNDFVNIYKFSDSTEELVPCFKDVIVQVILLHKNNLEDILIGCFQASDENKRTIKEALSTLKPENIANFTSALVTAFEILHKVRKFTVFQDSRMNNYFYFICSIIVLGKVVNVTKPLC